MDNKNFNIILAGVGGQGIITLLSIIDEAAFVQGYDVKSSELHGLSQRGGGVQAHVRFGRKINSPLIPDGKADLVISLEMTEALRALAITGKQTKFLVNEYYFPFQGSPSLEDIKNNVKINNFHLVPASAICKEKFQNEVLSTLYILGFAVGRKMLPIKKESVIKAINNIVPEKYREMNIKAFELGENIATPNHG